GRAVGAEAGGTIANGGPGPARLSGGDGSVREGDSGTSLATFTVSLDRPSTGTVRVHAETHDGTASAAGNDYIAVARDLSFAPGVVSQPFAVEIKGDTTFEPDETFTVDLSNAETAEI